MKKTLYILFAVALICCFPTKVKAARMDSEDEIIFWGARYESDDECVSNQYEGNYEDIVNDYTFSGYSDDYYLGNCDDSDYEVYEESECCYAREGYEDCDLYYRTTCDVNVRELYGIEYEIVDGYYADTLVHVSGISSNGWGKTNAGWICLAYAEPVTEK